MSANGKGSNARPRVISEDEWDYNYDNLDWNDCDKPKRKHPKKKKAINTSEVTSTGVKTP